MISSLKTDLVKRSSTLESRNQELEESRATIQKFQIDIGEVKSELEVYKTEKELQKDQVSTSTVEIDSLTSKIEVLEKALSEKREDFESQAANVKDLQIKLNEAIKVRDAAESESSKRLVELDSIQGRLGEVKELEQQVYDLKQELKSSEEKLPIIEMQKEGFEKATKLMEKERNLALEARDVAIERTKRYIKILGMEANTKTMILVDEVGSMTIADLAKSLGKPVGLVKKFVRELEKLGVLKKEGDKAISTLRDVEIEEGLVSLD